MKLRKKILLLISLLVFTLMLFSACSETKINKEDVEIFSLQKSFELAEQYLELVKNNNMDEANKLCTEKLIQNNQNILPGTSNIIAFAPDNVIESSKSAFIIFNVIRNSSSEPKCDLDNYAIRVIKEEGNYKIDEIKAMNLKQVFVRNRSLRMISEDGGSSDLIISLNNIPKDAYLKENEIMLYKEKVPADKFGPVSLGYRGKKVAISTISENRAFISVAYIEESKEAQGGANSQSESGSNTSQEGSNVENSLEDLGDKPIAKKIVQLDMLNDVTIDNLVFTQEERYLILEYFNSNNVKRIKVYNSSSGDLIDLNFNEVIPDDNYSIELLDFKKDEFTVNIVAKEGVNSINKEIPGKYNVNIESKVIKKI